MNETEFEAYKFFRLYSIDLDTAGHTLRILRRYKRDDVRYILIRELAITYARPFSDNKGILIKNHKLTERVVPAEFKLLHKELLRLRNEQFAHTDLRFYKPKVARFGTPEKPWYPMSFKGYDYSSLLRQISDIGRLIRAVEASLLAKLQTLEGEFE